MRALGAAFVIFAAACASGAAGGPEPAEPAGPAADGAPAGAVEREGRGDAVLVAPHPHASIVVHRVDTVSMDLPAGTQVQAFERTAYLSAVAERSGDAHQMTFVLDSIVAPEGSFLPADSLAAAAGTRWTARLLPDGQLVDLAMDTVRGRPRTAVGEQTTRILEVLYPVLPEDGAKAGGAWSDSVETRTQTSGFEVTERGTVSYQAATQGRGGLQITGRGTFRQEGSGTQFGQELEMSGTGERSITYRLDGNGRLVGAEGTDGAVVEIIVPAVGQTVPLTQNSRFEITIAAR